jgi:hypothetical protein
MLLLKKNVKRHLAIGGGGLFMFFGIMDQVKAEDPLDALTNTAASTAPSTTTKPNAGADAKLPASAPTPTVTKPAVSTSTSTATKPATNSADQALGGLSIDELLNVTVTSAGQ